MGKDYYAILGVSKNATEAELRKAYKKAALKWHPDRNVDKTMAEAKFKDINEAYEGMIDFYSFIFTLSKLSFSHL
jgi:DnaJ-class molecular chaperone